MKPEPFREACIRLRHHAATYPRADRDRPTSPPPRRMVGDAGTPAQHVICDEYFDALPE